MKDSASQLSPALEKNVAKESLGAEQSAEARAWSSVLQPRVLVSVAKLAPALDQQAAVIDPSE